MAGWRQRLQCNRFLYELLFLLCFDRPRAPQPSAGIEALRGCSCPKGLTPMTGYEPGRGKGPSVRRSTHSLSLYLIWRWPRRRCGWQIHVGGNSSLESSLASSKSDCTSCSKCNQKPSYYNPLTLLQSVSHCAFVFLLLFDDKGGRVDPWWLVSGNRKARECQIRHLRRN
jgi:hypothetical protein